MASSSRSFRKPKNSEEERKLLESATPKSTQAVTKWSLKVFRQQHQVSNILGPSENLETTGKASNAEVMGNDMESLLPADLNFEISDDVLSNMPLPDYGYRSNVIQNFSGSVTTVLLILYRSKFNACVNGRTLNIHPPVVVSVDVLIINIHKSRAVTLYLIKHRILIRKRFSSI